MKLFEIAEDNNPILWHMLKVAEKTETLMFLQRAGTEQTWHMYPILKTRIAHGSRPAIFISYAMVGYSTALEIPFDDADESWELTEVTRKNGEKAWLLHSIISEPNTNF
jgi:hypothetical protein